MDTTLFSSIPKESDHHHHFFFNTNNPKHQVFITTTNNTNDHIATNMDNNNTQTMNTTHSSDSAAAVTEPWSEKWAPGLLKECARAISEKDSGKIHRLLWMLNELSSPYGDTSQKLAYCFLQALFCKATASGHRCHRTLTAVAEKGRSFDSARRLILKFQEVSPWTTFGHVASNGALLEALDGEANLHIIDISNTLCTQWPTLLEALATRYDDTPRLRLTVVDVTSPGGGGGAVMKEIGQRMEKFARLMGVPFEMCVASGADARQLTREGLGIRDGEAVAVNLVGALRRAGFDGRERAVSALKLLQPKVLVVVDEEADFEANYKESNEDEDEDEGFVSRFEECLRFYTLYFEMLEESFSSTSNEKLMLERECSRGVVRVLACDDDDLERKELRESGVDFEWESETRETGKRWCERLRKAFSPLRYSDDVLDDVKALLKRYPSGWGLVQTQQQQQQQSDDSAGIYLTWKDEPVVWASAWKP